MFKFRTIFTLALLLLFVAVPTLAMADGAESATPTKVTTINYLALGDSLAFGITPEGQPGNGYPDFLAASLQSLNLLQSSNKGFSYPGYATADILKDLKENVSKPILGIGHQNQQAELHHSIAEANLITISIGSNDVLPNIKIDPASGTPTFNLADITAAIQNVGVNYSQILQGIYTINPTVQIYVMGYYNSFPYLAAEYQPQLGQLLDGLNGAIQAGMKGTTAIYVPTMDIISKDYPTYLPNSSNIHLSEAGYKAVAEAFGKQLLADNSGSSEGDVPTPQFSDIDQHWAKPFIEQAVEAGIVFGYSDGTFKPEKVLTRAEATSLLVRAFGLKTDQASPFKDIQQFNSNTQAEIAAAYQFGIVKENDGFFKPNEPIKRAHLALMVKRSYELAKGELYSAAALAPYSDIASLDTETQTAISMLHEFEIISGTDGKFMPNDPTTRAQAAKIFVNYSSLMK
ncbi:hypothetical protein BK133_20680 [Paenibacillus sp. FSL H8-0548]|uniref:S-layer homology domain-containing protein n=1 Tax=Paenibacillus sp. FSL H8-0548 TaxID=1920422 RepID=UPI00096DEBB6|nr:S-layer homology domain-containing protein [Paenibacillus sp. FSL H8-0548]OMF26266.1 hypothetical protein BK133_20680 [Paenibacillus sp. FSL H8-0548]